MTQEKEGFFYEPILTYAMKSQEKDTLSQDKSASEYFINMVKEWADSYIKSTELPSKILEQAKIEHLSDTVVRNVIDQALRERGLSERRIHQLMPAELKDPVKITKKPAISAAISAATRGVMPEPRNTEDDELPPEMEAIGGKYDSTAPAVEEEEDREKALLRDEVDQLRDAIKKLQQFPKASELQTMAAKVEQPKEEEDLNVIVLKERIVLIEKDLTKARDLVMRQLMQLKGRGWHIVELSARYIS